MRFIVTANEFAEAARALHEQIASKRPIDGPAYVLYGHSIEMALKSFLRAEGWSPDKLRKKLGHDLNKALGKARNEGLETYVKITNRFEEQLGLLNEIHLSREFFYPKVGFKKLPLLKHVAEMSDSLIKNIYPVVAKHAGLSRKTLPKTR